MSVSGKLMAFTAPSGSGKTTIVHHILDVFPNTSFSVSATTRARRAHEIDGKDYYFVSVETFTHWIYIDAFVEWEEVYPGQFYGTLKSEITRLHEEGRHILFDVDVRGALDIKQLYPEETLTVFIKVPSMEELRRRLIARGTDTPEQLHKRLAKAAYELSFEPEFDVVLINDQLDKTLEEAEMIVRNFLL